MPSTFLRIPNSLFDCFLCPCLTALVFTISSQEVAHAQNRDWQLAGNPDLQAYFESEVAQLESDNDLTRFASLNEWEAARTSYRQQLFDMLGLAPLPDRTPLQPMVTGVLENEAFVVQKVHFQSLPGLYVTGDLYLPKNPPGPLPAVLYVCGHGPSKKGDTSFGNKVTYQHHGAWFARNGFICLTIDSLQLGEIEGIHHGTHRFNRWWWNARGYTPAGVEAWNCMRALDYLESRPEVDSAKLGVTGRSGGGAYSWWIAALDDRIQCAVPVAGITTLRNHVVDGCVEGHCDCMFFVNTWRWDYPMLAALVAPRPLLISNTDKDSIFPLEGVVEIHRQVRHIYQLYGKPDHLGLNITEGPHKDTQELRTHAFVWLNRFLRKDPEQFTAVATPFFEPEQLRVFSELPPDQINTEIDQQFVPAAPQPTSDDLKARLAVSADWLTDVREQIRTRCFAAWPPMNSLDEVRKSAVISSSETLRIKDLELASTTVTFTSQSHVPLSYQLLHAPNTQLSDLKDVTVIQLDENAWSICQAVLKPITISESPTSDSTFGKYLIEQTQRMAQNPESAIALFAPRGQGPHRWNGSEARQTQIQRRFQLIGTTVDSMRVWDHLAMLQTLRGLIGDQSVISITATGTSPDLSLCTAIFDEGSNLNVLDLHLTPEPRSDQQTILNISRTVATTELLLLALLKTPIRVSDESIKAYADVAEVTVSAEWKGRKLSPPAPREGSAPAGGGPKHLEK